MPRDPKERGHGIPRGTLKSGKLGRLGGDTKKNKWPDGSRHAYALSVREFEPYLKANYADAPLLTGKGKGDFTDKDGVILFGTVHADILKDGKVRYNDLTNDPDYNWTAGQVKLFQHVVIKPTKIIDEGRVRTFVFEMTP